MRDKKLSIWMTAVLAIFFVTLLVTGAVAQTETVLYSFNDKDGDGPSAELIFDASGNLYGTTVVGGAHGGGTVFELTPMVGEGWTETVLHNFPRYTRPEQGNLYASVIFDNAGNLYGTSALGGPTYEDCSVGCGTVFELTPQAGGGWADKILHAFHEEDGRVAYGGLVWDASGNLYGTTWAGGGGGGGMVFKLAPKTGGGWSETILHSFGSHADDAADPYSSLIFDASGNLYGTTQNGGAYTYGAVFELTPKVGGEWGEKILLSFDGGDGANSYGGLIFDAAGNLYGTTIQGGPSCSCGEVFELTPEADGSWAETILHSFSGMDGGGPYGNLIFDAAGNLYGTTAWGGAYGYGTVFELSPNAGGGWTETVLHSFNNDGDGYWPAAGLIFDGAGNLYGTTQEGGAYGDGMVFEITP